MMSVKLTRYLSSTFPVQRPFFFTQLSQHHKILGTGTFKGYMNQNLPKSVPFSDGFILVDLTEISEEEFSQVKPLHVITWRQV
jgi:hypothetical protein